MALGVLALPGASALALVFWLRSRAREPEAYESELTSEGVATPPPASADAASADAVPRRYPAAFWVYSGFTALTMTGYATFGLLSFHMVEAGVLAAPWVPLVYAAVMLVDALVALGTGWLFDRIGPRVLLGLPVLCAAVPVFAFTESVGGVIAGALLWGAALGIQESTLRATIAGLIPRARRASAYGVYAAVLGVAAAIGGALAGWLYGLSIPALVVVTVAIQAAALLALALFLRRERRSGAAVPQD